MHAAHCQKYFFFFTFVKLSHCKNYNQTTTTLNKMTVLYNHTNCCNLQALLVLLLVLPLTRNISNRQSLGSWNLLKSFFFHFLNHNNIHHFINSFGDFDDNEKKKISWNCILFLHRQRLGISSKLIYCHWCM